MDQKTLDDVIEEAMRKDGGEYLWNKLNAVSTAPSAEGCGLFCDPKFLNEVQRFMEKNRLPFATSISRYALHRALLRLRELLEGNSNGGAPPI
jgi:hypothetical protein